MFLQVIDGYYNKVNDPVSKGGAFFAVCRGKVRITHVHTNCKILVMSEIHEGQAIFFFSELISVYHI